MKKLMLLVFLSFVLTACTDTTEIIRAGGTVPNNKRLTADDSFYISVPKDGKYGDIIYFGSGEMTSRLLVSSFAKRARNVQMAKTYLEWKENIRLAEEGGLTYLVHPTILHWEDRLTEWSGKSDRIEVRVEVFEAKSSTIFDSVVMKGTSKWLTFGGDHPQDMLPDLFEEFAASLFIEKAK